jgi:hypothetical protein
VILRGHEAPAAISLMATQQRMAMPPIKLTITMCYGAANSSTALAIWGKLFRHAPGGMFSEIWIWSLPLRPPCSRISRAAP